MTSLMTLQSAGPSTTLLPVTNRVAQMPATAPSPTQLQVTTAVAARSLQPLPALMLAAARMPGVGLLLRDAQGFVPDVQRARPVLTSALKQLDDALPPAPTVHKALALMSPAQKTVVANTALLLLARHQRGQLNGAELRFALQRLLNDGADIRVGTPAGAAGAGATSPPKLPRLLPIPDKSPIAIAPQLRPRTVTGPEMSPDAHKAIEKLIADRSALVPGFVWPSEPHLSIEAILEAIAEGSPEELGALLRELAQQAPEVFKWLVQQDFFVEAIGRRLDVADLPRALEIPQVLQPLLRKVLPANFEPTGRDLLATLLSLSRDSGALGRFNRVLPALAPALHQWLQAQPWFTQLLNWSAGLAPPDQRLLTLRNERGQPVRADALPAYDAGSSLHMSYIEGTGGTQRLFVVPGANATVNGEPAPGRLEASEEPFAAIIQASSGQTRGLHPLQVFTATVTPEGLLRMVGNARPNDNVMQAVADTSQRPVTRTDGAVAAPAVLKQQLKSTAFVFSENAGADRMSEDLRLTQAVVKLGQGFGVDALPQLLQSVRSRLQADDMLPEANAQLADFMRVMQHDSAPEAQQRAAESLARKLGLAAPQDRNAKLAKELLDEITQYVRNHHIQSLQRRDAGLDAQLLRPHRPGWLRNAKAELLQRSQADSLLGVIALYYRELLEFAAPKRR